VSSIPPTRRLVVQPLLGPGDCEALIASIAGPDWRPGTIGRPDAGVDRIDAPVRSCETAVVPDGLLLARVEAVARWVNDQCFGFRLDGLSAADPAAVIRYRQGDHFAWHPDIGALGTPSARRKLSFTLQLSDPSSYEGGDLELGVHHLTGSPTDTLRAHVRAQGTLALFPSFLVHRVTPVRVGVRHAIVGWLHGPPFT
jgi:PKHD-type hydroxylase